MPARRCLDAVGDSALTLVRPLLGAGRSEVRAWLDALGQPFRDDASNADLSRTRARIRHDLLPKLASDYNPRVALALVRLGALAAESQSALRGWLERVSREATVEATSGVLVFLNARLARLPRAVRVEALRLAWQRAGWPERDMNTARWRRLAAMVRPAHNRDPGRFSLGAGVEVWLSTDLLRLTRAHHELGVVDLRPAPVRLPVPGAAIWGAGRVVATLDPAEPRDETVDLDALGPELWVRAPAAGDRFGPLGMEGRTMPLSDFLRGRKVGRAERGRVPLVCDGPGIVWVAGHRIADRVRMREATARALGLRWEPGPVWRGSRGAVSPPPQPSPTTGGGS